MPGTHGHGLWACRDAQRRVWQCKVHCTHVTAGKSDNGRPQNTRNSDTPALVYSFQPCAALQFSLQQITPNSSERKKKPAPQTQGPGQQIAEGGRSIPRAGIAEA